MTHVALLPLMMCSMLILAAQDSLVKLISSDISVWQLYLVRSVIIVGGIVLFLRVTGSAATLHAPRWAVLRGLLLGAAFVFYYGAFPLASLAQASAGFTPRRYLLRPSRRSFSKNGSGRAELLRLCLGFPVSWLSSSHGGTRLSLARCYRLVARFATRGRQSSRELIVLRTARPR